MAADDPTHPAVAETSEAAQSEVPAYGLALAWSEEEPWRIGEAGFCRPLEASHFGRGGACVVLERHRPGVRWGDRTGPGGIAGKRISRLQLETTGSAVGIKVGSFGT